MTRSKKAPWIPALCLALLAATVSRAELPAMSYSRSTGDFLLRVPTSQGYLVNSGTAGDGSVDAVAQLEGTKTKIGLVVNVRGTVADVVVRFPQGVLNYQLGDSGDGARGRLISSTLPPGACASLETLPVLVAVREAFGTLNQRERGWERLPNHDDWARVVSNLAFFFLGAEFTDDCKALAREEDTKGCDSVARPLQCGDHGACCDEHDACYAKHNCSVASWGCGAPGIIGGILCFVGGGPKCEQCNMEVVACFIGPPTGPAQCCSDGSCGDPQPPGGPGTGK